MSYQWTSRLDRALTQRIYVIEGEVTEQGYSFQMMGSTDTVYRVNVGASGANTIACSCPDHAIRGSFCKHMICLCVRVLRMTRERVRDAAFDDRHCHIISDACKAFFNDRQHYKAPAKDEGAAVVQPKPIEADDDCPICFEAFAETADEPTVWCKAQCGKSVHAECFKRWAAASRGSSPFSPRSSHRSSPPTCVYCRAKWK